MLRTGNTDLCGTKHHELSWKLLRIAKPFLLTGTDFLFVTCVSGHTWGICGELVTLPGSLPKRCNPEKHVMNSFLMAFKTITNYMV